MRRLHLVLAAALLLACGVAFGVWKYSTPEVVVLSLHDQAQELVETCQWADAIAACDALLEQTPDDAQVLFWRGQAKFALDQHEAAIADYSAAIAQNPSEAEFLYCRGMVYERLGKIHLADADYEAARLVDPRKDQLAASIRAEQNAVDVRRAVREASKHADELAAKRMAAKNAKGAARAAAIRESNRADELAAEIAKNERAIAKSAGSDVTTEAETKTWAGMDITDRYAAKPALPDVVLPAIADPSSTSVGEILTRNPFLLGSVEGNRAAGNLSGDAAPEMTLPESEETLPESEGADETAPPTGQSVWQQLQQQQSVQRGLSAVTESADQHTLFVGPRLTGIPATTSGTGPASNSTVAPVTLTPGGLALPGLGGQSALGTGSPFRTLTNQSGTAQAGANPPLSKYPVQGWNAPQHGAGGLLTQQSSTSTGNNVTRPAAATGTAINLPTRSVQGGPVLRPTVVERTAATSSRRDFAGQLTTAASPLPAPAVDRSSARAAARPGVLSTATYEFVQPAVVNGEVELSTHTSPLPIWTPPPISAQQAVPARSPDVARTPVAKAPPTFPVARASTQSPPDPLAQSKLAQSNLGAPKVSRPRSR